MADFPKIKAAGFQPLAVGSQDFQVGYLTHALIAAVAGPDIYDRFYGPTSIRRCSTSPRSQAG